jgi:Spy/CpxP family protein refolding chaperone
MLPRRIFALALVLLSIGGVVLVRPKLQFPQLIARAQQNPLPRQQKGLIQELNLTPSQIRQMQAIRKQYKDQIAQRNTQLRQAQQELRDLIASTAPADEVRQKHDQVKALQQQLGDLRFESTLATRQILTPDQRRKFVERMQKQQKPQKAVVTQQR